MMRLFFVALVFISISSCSTPPAAPVDSNSTETKSPTSTSQRVQIDTTNFSIELLSTMKIKGEQGLNSTVYYITQKDTTTNKGEGGIYFGPKPQVYPPSTDYTKREIPGVFLGKPTNWIEYTTKTYVQREIFIDIPDGNKIHCWCYSSNPLELEQLFTMMNSIQKTKQ